MSGIAIRAMRRKKKAVSKDTASNHYNFGRKFKLRPLKRKMLQRNKNQNCISDMLQAHIFALKSYASKKLFV